MSDRYWKKVDICVSGDVNSKFPEESVLRLSLHVQRSDGVWAAVRMASIRENTLREWVGGSCPMVKEVGGARKELDIFLNCECTSDSECKKHLGTTVTGDSKLKVLNRN